MAGAVRPKPVAGWEARLRALAVVAVAVLLIGVPLGHDCTSADEGATHLQFVEDAIDLGDGRIVVPHVCPLPPGKSESTRVDLSLVEAREAAGTLSQVPLFDWCYGCSATSAAMLFGYYDRAGYPDMYLGPANGGVCPLNNETAWRRGESPLSATHEGYDGLAEKGHVDDYWASYGSTLDPYDGEWAEHDYADCTADFMGTNQYVNWHNTDGSTTFYYYLDNTALYDYDLCESGSPPKRDGCHGMRLFAESRGYTVVSNYNQYIYGYGGTDAGFTFDQYKQEIDAGHPVLIQVDGHTMLGVGYDDPDTVYIHDTWGYDVHSMTWGGAYSGLVHYGVTVIELEPTVPLPEVVTVAADPVEETTATLRGTLTDDGGENCDYRFRHGTSPGAYTVESAWTGPINSVQDFSEDVTGLSKGIAYYYVAQARNVGTATGSEVQFVTKPDPPVSLSGVGVGADTIDLDWVKGEGAGNAQVQRTTGSYPTDRTDGVTVYYGDAVAAIDSGLAPETTYYYRAWSEASAGGQWSDGFAQAEATTLAPGPSVSTQTANPVMADSATLNGAIDDDLGQACEYRFEYDIDSGVPYDNATAWTGPVVAGPFSEAVSDLQPATAYYFRAGARHVAGSSSCGSELSFTTKPAAPLDFASVVTGTQSIDLSWTPGQGATQTTIVRKVGSYPANRTDGDQIYHDSGSAFPDSGLSPGTDYYYRAWSFDDGSSQWSDDYAETNARTDVHYDFGDAPDPDYPTFLATDGARHVIDPSLYLGSAIDDEDDGQPNANATGDDSDVAGDDEDGVVFNSAYEPGQETTLTVTASLAGLLDAWVDFNGNGSWTDTGEQVFTSEPLVGGANSLKFSVPEGAFVEDSTFARFRFSSAGGLLCTGEAEDGEVEDYELSYQRSIELPLKAGWNMVSVPVRAADMSTSAIFDGAKAVYTWNPNSKSYSMPPTIDPRKGYWVAVSSDRIVTVEGTPVVSWSDTPSTGWNMMGSVYGAVVDFSHPNDVPDGSVAGFAYTWNPDSKSYLLSTNVQPGRGYWVAATASCTLALGLSP